MWYLRITPMARPSWKQKNSKMFIFVSKAHLTSAFTSKTHTFILYAEQLHCNGISGDVRIACKEGQLRDNFDVSYAMDSQFIPAGSSIYASLLQECINKKSLLEGKLVHAHMIQMGFIPDVHLKTRLVSMYAKCGSLENGRRALDEMPEGNVVTWTAMIAACGKLGRVEEAFTLFYQMQRRGIQPDQFTFASVLPACANESALEHGRKLHEDIIRGGFQSNVFVERALADMYIKCGSIEDARQVFDKMTERDTVSWTKMIAGYAQNARVDDALELFQRMPERDMVSWNAMITGHAQNGHVREALNLFQKMHERNVVSWTAMIAGYAQNGHVEEAQEFFQKMPERNVVSWNTMIAGHAQNGNVEKALELFQRMPEQNVVSWNTVIAGYAQNDSVVEALGLFQKIPEQNVVSWDTMIAGYAENGHFNEALKLFQQMQILGVKPNSVTFLSVLPACSSLAAVEHGMKVHDEIIRSGFQSDISVANALIDMYAKCGNLQNASRVFEKMPKVNVVSWTEMITGYAYNGYVNEALKFFQKMHERSVVSWNTMIAGYAQNGYFKEALKLFQQMQHMSIKPYSVSFASVLSACAKMAALEHGKEVHEDIIRNGFQSDILVSNAIVDMYAKCGSIVDAKRIFDKMLQRDAVSWTAMIVGYAIHGFGKDALQLFEQMQHSGTKPNHITFVGVLTACCHAGLVNNGWEYFDCMTRDYHITPTVQHYCCMVDLLGRAGLLDEAHEFINKMPIEPNAAVWGSLLGACRIHINIKLAERVAECLFKLDHNNAAHYVLLSNIYAEAGRWDDADKVRIMMKDRKLKHRPGCSRIEVNNEECAFLVGACNRRFINFMPIWRNTLSR